MLHGYPPFRGITDRDKCKLILSKTYMFGLGIPDDARNLISNILVDSKSRPTIKDVLRHHWVSKFSNNQLEEGWEVILKDLGQGVIRNVRGLICEVEFDSCKKDFVVDDLIQIGKIIELEESDDYRHLAGGLGLIKSTNKSIKIKEEKKNVPRPEINKEKINLTDEHKEFDNSDANLQDKIKELNQLKQLLEAPAQKKNTKAKQKSSGLFDSLLSGFSCVKR